MTVDINKQLKAMVQSHEQIEINLVVNFLQTKFKSLFEKYKKLESISVEANEYYNDNETSYDLNLETDAIIINGYSLFSLEDNDIDQDQCEKNTKLSYDEFDQVASEASDIFNEIKSEYYTRVFGNQEFSITVKPDSIEY